MSTMDTEATQSDRPQVATDRPVTGRPTTHARLLAWVQEVAELTTPDAIHWVDGSDAENARLIEEMLASGTLSRLNREKFPNCYLHRSEWDYYEVSADQCPRITKEFIEEERRANGDLYVQQEYFNQFIDVMGSAFSEAEIASAFDSEVEEWNLLPDL